MKHEVKVITLEDEKASSEYTLEIVEELQKVHAQVGVEGLEFSLFVICLTIAEKLGLVFIVEKNEVLAFYTPKAAETLGIFKQGEK